MKKQLTLVLALAFLVFAAVPAMAFTSDGENNLDEYPIDLYLVEYDDSDDFFYGSAVVTSLPEDDRGYVTNEIVGAVASITVPKYASPADDMALYITGENVTFFRTTSSLAPIAGTTAENAGYEASNYYDEDGDFAGYLFGDSDMFEGISKEKTYQWLVFAKVDEDDASLTLTLESGYAAGDSLSVSQEGGSDSISFEVSDNDYSVYVKGYKTESGYYLIELDGYNDYVMVIFFDEGYETTAMFVVDEDSQAAYEVTTSSKLYEVASPTNFGSAEDFAETGLDDITVISGSVTNKSVSRFLDEVCSDLDLDPFNCGNILRPAYFSTGSSTEGSVEVTVEISPWEAYLSVPDVVVVDPPKTGESATLAGYAMILAAVIGVVVFHFKKVNA